MYLELAENGGCNCENATLPVRDSQSGRIVFFNVEALKELNNEEIQDVIDEAPYLVQKIAAANNNEIEFDEANEIVMNTIAPNRQMADCGPKPGAMSPEFNEWARCQYIAGNIENVGGQMMPQTQMMPQGGFDPKFSIDIEPNPKPWYARTEVLIPVGLLGLGAVYFLTRK